MMIRGERSTWKVCNTPSSGSEDEAGRGEGSVNLPPILEFLRMLSSYDLNHAVEGSCVDEVEAFVVSDSEEFQTRQD